MRLEKRTLAFGDTLARCLKEWFEKAVDLFWVAVVRVESDENIVLFCENVGRFCQYDCSIGSIVDVQARCELAASSGNLDYTVRF